MILLTGASGFIGKHLLNGLINTYGADNILAFTSKPLSGCSFLLHNDYNFGKDYFFKNGLADKIDVIIHAGAFIPKNSSWANDWKQCNQNIINCDKLLEAELHGLKKIVYLSSVDVYGMDDIISESTVVEPVSLYGHSKLYCEKLITSWAEAENKNSQVLRIGHVYGPGEDGYQKVIPVTMRKIMNGDTLEIWGSGEELRAYIYVGDVVRAILKSLKLNIQIGVVNLVSNQSVSITELVKKIADISGKKVNINLVPKGVANRNLVFDNKKMRQYLLSSEISLAEGLKEEWTYMKGKFG